jgi:hypothetical protein
MSIPRQRFTLTAAEWDALHVLCEKFYDRFGKLIADLILEVPTADMEEQLLIMLQERASVYGSNYSEHIGRAAGVARDIINDHIKKEEK